jgi:hypothetical protein
MVHKRMVAGVAAAIFTVALTASGAAAVDPVNPETFTCEQFLKMDPDEQEHTAYWIEGWAVANKKVLIGGLPLQSMNRPAGPLAKACATNPKATLIQTMPNNFK